MFFFRTEPPYREPAPFHVEQTLRQRAELLAIMWRMHEQLDVCLLLWYRAGMPASHRAKIAEIVFTLLSAQDALRAMYLSETTTER